MTSLLFLLLSSISASAASWCTWTESAYTGWTHLLLPDTDLAWGSVHGDAITLSGQLQDGAQGPTLRATLRQDGVSVSGDIDPAEGLVFRAGQTFPLGTVALVAEGAPIQPIALFPGGAVQVRGGRYSMEDVDLRGLDYGVLPCTLVLLSGRWNHMDESADILASLGVKDDTERAYLRRHRVPLQPAPGFPRGGTFKRGAWPREVAVLERQGRYARIAYGHYDGVVWTGWVRSRHLMGPDEAGLGGLGTIGGGIGGGQSDVIHTCDAALPLRARVGDRVVEVGAMAAATPFKIRAVDADGVSVQLTSSWLSVEEGAQLLLPLEAERCPSTTRAAMSLEEILQEKAQ